MANFKYVAKEQDGKTVTGTLESADRANVIETLRKKDLIIVSVSEGRASAFKMALLSKKRIKLDDLVVFSRQLATMVDAGIPLVGALDILSEQMENNTFQEVLLKIRNDVETGSSLSDALAKHKRVFSALFINMVKAGDSTALPRIWRRRRACRRRSNPLLCIRP